jgi:DNA-binding NtrC family response regulator
MAFPCIIGQDPKMKAIFRQTLEAAPYDYPVHLSGATGTGKELVARAIHDHSERRRRAFVAVNCGALPENLVESELFGHVKGAFSGADRSRKGRFELAHRGTLFLDEVADLPPHVQIQLLRVLQCGQFEKVGAERTTRVDVRIVSATNKPLKDEMKAGRFREDLYYRLNVVPIHMPPLKSRRGDIPLLARHFLHLAATCYHRHPIKLTERAVSALERYHWPGNVRELQNAVHFAFVRSGGRVIDAMHLPIEIQQAPRMSTCRRLTAETVARALNRCRGNKSHAARDLGVGRATLYRFLSSHAGAGCDH